MYISGSAFFHGQTFLAQRQAPQKTAGNSGHRFAVHVRVCISMASLHGISDFTWGRCSRRWMQTTGSVLGK